MDDPDGADAVKALAQPVLDAFYNAVLACGREPPFKPTLSVQNMPGSALYDTDSRAVILVPYEALQPARRAAMERFASIGTLGLSGREQYRDIFNSLLVAHELGHWLQDIARRPLSRWQAEYQANQLMVAFWRGHPAQSLIASPENRLANFVAQAPNTPSPLPADYAGDVGAYFNAHIADIESNPMAYAGFQKWMVRQVIAERPVPTFCELVSVTWPR
jgi:hypothetical protein